MAGTAKLTGDNLTVALKMLNDVTTVLDSMQIRHCLDGGTLLGIMRENRLLPWDDDLDLFTPADGLKRVKAAMWKLRRLGYWTATHHHRVDQPPFKMGGARVIKVKTRKWFLPNGPINLDIFIKYKSGDDYYWIAGSKKNYVIKSVPAEYYEQLAQIEFNNKKYWIPEACEDYLTVRYGDWRIPVEEWNNRRDDKAIRS
ncbi:MAG: LicD family protein [Candidatus Marinimicrobia bacterium]|nr:LicD family protein [Candidatus Neomarinimicrobiota bacterium]